VGAPGGLAARSRATKEANWRAACQSAIQSCDEIESKDRPVEDDIVILAWQT
jgi:hypothetical protein